MARNAAMTERSGPRRRPVNRTVQRGAFGGGHGFGNITDVRTRRGRGMWSTPQAAWADETRTLRRELIASCRHQWQSNPVYRRIINALVEHIVSTGFRLVPNTGDAGWNKAARDILRERFKREHFTPRGLKNEWEVAKSIVINQKNDGGVFVYRPRGYTQVFEEAQVYTPADKWGKSDVIDGIQFDEKGHVNGYWAGPYSLMGDVDQTKMTLLPAWHVDEDLQIKLPITSYLRVDGFASSYRGTPLLASSLDDLERMADVFNNVAERVAQEACIMGTIKSDDPNAAASINVDRADQDSTAKTQTDEAYNQIQWLEPGIVGRIKQNEEFDLHTPGTPNNNFESFIKMSARQSALPASMPIEVALLHFSDTNFSAARGAIELYKMSCRMDKKELAEEYSTYNYLWTIYEAMQDGDLTYRSDWMEHRVGLSGWRYLEPKKDAEAASARMENGLSTLTEELADRGLELEDELRESASERKAAERISQETGEDVEAILLRAYQRNGAAGRPTSDEDDSTTSNGENT